MLGLDLERALGVSTRLRARVALPSRLTEQGVDPGQQRVRRRVVRGDRERAVRQLDRLVHAAGDEREERLPGALAELRGRRRARVVAPRAAHRQRTARGAPRFGTACVRRQEIEEAGPCISLLLAAHDEAVPMRFAQRGGAGGQRAERTPVDVGEPTPLRLDPALELERTGEEYAV